MVHLTPLLISDIFSGVCNGL